VRIKYLPLQPHCFAFGGFDIQMLQTMDAARACGVNVLKLDIWSRDIGFDILHCWGLGFSHHENYFWTKKTGKKLVATILMHDIESAFASLKFKLSAIISKQRVIIDMLKMVDELVVVNENQAEIANIYYKVPAGKVHIIPNVVNERYFSSTEADIKLNTSDYVLTTGNVCPRKNQVALAEACIHRKIKLVIIGKVLQGEELYGDSLVELAKNNPELITWIPGLGENSEELIGYYKNCRLFALPSFVEQQPISALEAAVSQKPLLLANRAYAKQKFYKNACLVDPASVQSITKGLQDVWQNGNSYIAPANILNECRAQQVGLSYKKIYEGLMI
jgi:glycosyltransferase involved in cell wall biosynthesis